MKIYIFLNKMPPKNSISFFLVYTRNYKTSLINFKGKINQ